MTEQRQTQEVTFDEVVERGCRLDVHRKEIVATVSGTGIESETRTFQSTTRSLTELKEWLLALGVTHVAMESTGVYWKPVMNILEPGSFTIMVVNARHIKYVPGHKTDKKDSAWICKLHANLALCQKNELTTRRTVNQLFMTKIFSNENRKNNQSISAAGSRITVRCPVLCARADSEGRCERCYG